LRPVQGPKLKPVLRDEAGTRGRPRRGPPRAR
jgi:hypothetical protein